MCETRIIRFLIMVSLTSFLVMGLISPAMAQEQSFQLPGGDLLVIEGEDFIFETNSVAEGEPTVMESVAVWEGGVTARFDEIVLETDHVQGVFSGSEISSLRAGPQVKLTGLDGRAVFECSDVLITLPTQANPGNYTGILNQVHGYYLANAAELGLEGTQDYEINFTAETALIGPDTVTLKWPEFSLGDLEHPDLAVRSREITLQIGTSPVTGKRAVLGVLTANASLSLFGLRLNLLPVPYYRGFEKVIEPGLSFALPKPGWEGDQGFGIDQTVLYYFTGDQSGGNPRLWARVNCFPSDRTYPEVGGAVTWGCLDFGLRTGYRREEDPNGDPVATLAEPEFTIESDRLDLGYTGFGFKAGATAGHVRDLTDDVASSRWGYHAILTHPGIPIGGVTLSGGLEFNDLYYGNGDNFRVLEGTARLRYVEPPHWGATLSYRRISEWGLTPFRFDVPQFREELGLREQTRLGRRWGVGFDLAYDFSRDEFRNHEYHLTYIFDSFQITLGWDFAGNTADLQFALPGSLR